MQIFLAIDSFKGSLTSLQAAQAIGRGLRRACLNAGLEPPQLTIFPLADGGEGTLDALTQSLPQTLRHSVVTGPLGIKIPASYALIPSPGGTVALIESAQAAGLTIVPPAQRNPLYTTTYGVGELIVLAMEEGAREFIVGLGGSATNDCGAGMLSALGYRFLDSAGRIIGPVMTCDLLEKVAEIDETSVHPLLKQAHFRVACDVTNPLCGKQGASAVFGPQKGAKETDIARMDAALSHFASVAAVHCVHDKRSIPGAGAAGGLGYAFFQFMNAQPESGSQLIMDALGIDHALQNADLVVTGEGRLDAQTVQGKAPIGIARRAKKYGKRVIAFCGSASADASACLKEGIDAYYCCQHKGMSLEESMANAAILLEECAALYPINHSK